LAIFSWKKGDADKGKDAASSAGLSPGASGTGGTATPAASVAMTFSPERANRFFERANTAHETGSFPYAMSMWLSGLRQDPTSHSGLEGFFKSVASYMGGGGKGAPKDVLSTIDGKGELERYLRSLLDWGVHPAEAGYAVKALEGASLLGLQDAAVWIALRAMGAASKEKKPRKEHFIAIMEAMRKFEKYEMAVEAGEAAMRVDPSDAKLGALIRNISAESTMTKGGFNDAGEGGFRANVRDAERQSRLEEESKIVRTEETVDRMVAAAKAEYEANRLDRPNIMRYVQRLNERGTPEDEATVIQVAGDAYKATQEFRFLEEADKVRLKQARRRIAKLKQAADAPGASDDAKRAFRQGYKEYLELEVQALESQVKAYPTDLLRKYELGKRYAMLGRHEDAIGQFQEAKADVKNRADILHYLGVSFLQIGWLDEAVETHRQALETYSDPNDAKGMELRYGLMAALMARAAEQSDLANAEEAYKIASSIAIQQINFKDIRQRREDLKQLISKLKGGAGGSAPGGAH
jgi:tetratricopeptide (TPR) repeat protein